LPSFCCWGWSGGWRRRRILGSPEGARSPGSARMDPYRQTLKAHQRADYPIPGGSARKDPDRQALKALQRAECPIPGGSARRNPCRQTPKAHQRAEYLIPGGSARKHHDRQAPKAHLRAEYPISGGSARMDQRVGAIVRPFAPRAHTSKCARYEAPLRGARRKGSPRSAPLLG